uniref:Uncharacterized protein n=1 Tax=Arion vulgaris TaxID=1028688 RepID=A0A0B7A213_9EUPU
MYITDIGPHLYLDTNKSLQWTTCLYLDIKQSMCRPGLLVDKTQNNFGSQQKREGRDT